MNISSLQNKTKNNYFSTFRKTENSFEGLFH